MNTSVFRTSSVWIAAAVALAVACSAQAGPGKSGRQGKTGKPDQPTGQTLTFKVAADAKIVVGKDKAGKLADLKPGDRVGVGYTEESGVLVAHRIMDFGSNPEKPPQQPGGQPKNTKPGGPADQGGKHARGVVESVEVQTSTLIIMAKHPAPPPGTPPGKPAKP
jgi:hypothetical protein